MTARPPTHPTDGSPPTPARYFEFLGTPYVNDEGQSRQPAARKFIEALKGAHLAHRPRFDLAACLAGTQPGFTGQVWVWSDLHLFHTNILRYCDRPFDDVVAMNLALVQNCLARVDVGDILIFAGDVTMGNVAATNALLHAMPGYKINVLGNHDVNRKGELLALAVDETAACLELTTPGAPLFITHYPVSESVLEPGQINLHGHIHNQVVHPSLGNGARHRNLSVEHTGYAPVLLASLLPAVP